MLVTHVLILKTNPNLESQPQWQSLLQLLTTTTGLPVYAGRQEEDPSKLWLLTEWPTLTCWASAPTLQTHLDALLKTHTLTILSSFAIALQSEDRTALSAPTTEISMAFVQAGSEAAIRLQQATAIFVQKAAVLPGAAVGVVSGWTYDKELVFTGLDGVKGRGRGYFSLSGWESQEAHWGFPAKEVGTGDILAAGAEGWEVAHVKFEKVEAREVRG